MEDYGTTSLKINVELYYVLYTLTPPPPPTFPMQVKHTADAAHDSQLYWVHDGPLLAYLGVSPDRSTFAPTVIRREAMLKEVTALSHEPGMGGCACVYICIRM